MDKQDLDNRFRFHPANSEEKRNAHERVRGMCGNLAFELNDILPEGREKSLVMTKLEEVMYWSNASLAREE